MLILNRCQIIGIYEFLDSLLNQNEYFQNTELIHMKTKTIHLLKMILNNTFIIKYTVQSTNDERF